MADTTFQLPLTYFSQRDNGAASGYTCNTVSCWMLACYAKPELVARYGPNGDLDYYYPELVQPRGDTTDHGVQTAALNAIGVSSTWRTDATLLEVAEWVEQRRKPVELGIMHNSSLDYQETDGLTGGHMIVAHGTVRSSDGSLKALIISDPNGELNLRQGGYGISDDGAALEYSYANLVRRFETDSNGYYTPGPCGWARLLN